MKTEIYITYGIRETYIYSTTAYAKLIGYYSRLVSRLRIAILVNSQGIYTHMENISRH